MRIVCGHAPFDATEIVTVKLSENAQERGFSASARTDNAKSLTSLQREVDARDGLQDLAASREIDLAQPPQGNHARRTWVSGGHTESRSARSKLRRATLATDVRMRTGVTSQTKCFLPKPVLFLQASTIHEASVARLVAQAAPVFAP